MPEVSKGDSPSGGSRDLVSDGPLSIALGKVVGLSTKSSPLDFSGARVAVRLDAWLLVEADIRLISGIWKENILEILIVGSQLFLLEATAAGSSLEASGCLSLSDCVRRGRRPIGILYLLPELDVLGELDPGVS